MRLLRNLGLVTGEGKGRSVIYALYDNHVAELLDQALYHVEHPCLGLRDTSTGTKAADVTLANAETVDATG